VTSRWPWTLLFLALAACGAAPGGGGSGVPLAAPSGFATGADHPFFPLQPGTSWRYEGTDEGLPREERVRVLDEVRAIFGTACTAVRTEVFVDGALPEVTTEWFAVDRAGNLWMFGEESFSFDGGNGVLEPDAWEAGLGSAQPWMVFAADVREGDVYADSWRRRDVQRLLALDGVASVPAGTFAGCLVLAILDLVDVEDEDVVLYAPGVGRVSESTPTHRVDLVEHRPAPPR
jgi:hypothetical protein